MQNTNVKDALRADPLGMEYFKIEEDFEDIFNALKAANYQRYLQTGNVIYRNRSNELQRLKRTYPSAAWDEKKEAIQIYATELKQLQKEAIAKS